MLTPPHQAYLQTLVARPKKQPGDERTVTPPGAQPRRVASKMAVQEVGATTAPQISPEEHERLLSDPRLREL